MRILRWTGLTIALAAAAVVTGCGVEVYDSPGYPGPHSGVRGRYDDRSGDVEGTVSRVSRRDHVIVLNPGGEERGDRDEIVLFYDDDTTVEYQGRDFRPEDLERGDRIQATVDSRGDRRIAENIQVIYDASSDRDGRNDRGGMPPDRPDQPGPSRPDRGDQPGTAALRGTIRSVDPSDRTLEIEPAGARGDDSQDMDDQPSGLVLVHYDAGTAVLYQGRSYGAENLEDGDVVEIHLRRGRDGQPVAAQILVLSESGPRRSRS